MVGDGGRTQQGPVVVIYLPNSGITLSLSYVICSDEGGKRGEKIWDDSGIALNWTDWTIQGLLQLH